VTRLAGKVALVTGAGSGIGKAIAIALAREGAKVALAGRRKEKLDETAAEIRKGDPSAETLPVVCDITRSAETKAAVAQVEQTLGKLNVLVNNAGALSATTIETITEEEWDSLISTNLKGPFLMSRAVLPAMRRAGGGSIVNIGSALGLVAVKDRVAYCSL
jgi:NAD(P)-dependent dehydrogenase (short-subunit alcohol dehydrogenase family)